MEDYRSEFEAPNYSEIKVERIGTQVVRTVVLDGEFMTFEVERGVYAAGKALEDNARQQSDE